ncbi:MAG: hypothetical protein FJ164_08040 [Gammaproteobacteria bacterium]|nr:hypothetical protein [Gammaproteobacteria bacterium]
MHQPEPGSDLEARPLVRSRPAPPGPAGNRVLHAEFRTRAPLRLFLDELDYARAQAATLEVLGEAGAVLLSYCLLPDRVVLVMTGHSTLASARVAQLLARLEVLFRLRHGRMPPPCKISLRTLESARELARICARIQQLPVVLGLADSPRAWGWVGPEPSARS